MADVIGKTNAGGAGSGGILTVTAPAGVTVTATKDGKTYTKTANADGVAIFKGLATGTWSVTITDGSQTATQTVVINADYAVVMAFFSATIRITYPAGSVSHVEGPNGYYAQSPDTSGYWEVTVPAAGDYLVCADDSTTGQGVCKTVTITENGQNESMSLDYVLRLYNAGAFASGQSLVNDSTGTSGISYTENEDSINIVASNSQGYTYRYFEKPVDLTDKSVVKMTLHSNAAFTESGTLNYTIGASIWADSDTDRDWTSPNTKLKSLAANTDYEVSVDVSALSGEYYIWLKFSFTNTSSGKLDIDILSVEVE